jgi:signal peptidase I
MTKRLLGRWIAAALAAGLAALLLPAQLGGLTSFSAVSGDSMEPSLSNGDYVITRRGTYGIGDVIAYRVPEGDVGAGMLVLHRIVGGDAEVGYVTQGDNRTEPDRWRPKGSDVLGRKVLVIPGAGTWMIKVRTPLGTAAVASLLAIFAASGAWPSRRRRSVATEREA